MTAPENCARSPVNCIASVGDHAGALEQWVATGGPRKLAKRNGFRFHDRSSLRTSVPIVLAPELPLDLNRPGVTPNSAAKTFVKCA